MADKKEKPTEEIKEEPKKITTKKTKTTKTNTTKQADQKVTQEESTETKQKTARSTTKKSTTSTTPKKKTSTNTSTSKTSSANKKNSTTKKNTSAKTTTAKSTTKKTSNKSGTKTNNKSATSKKSSTGKTTKSAGNNDTKKIEKSKTTKKAKKTDDKIQKIIAEQLENVDKIEEIKDIPIKEKKKKKTNQIDEKKISQQIEKANKMPKDAKREIYKNMFTNILIGIFVTLYFVALGFGFINVESVAYITDLKVFSVATLAITIVLFEYSYNKDSGKFALIGIEMLFVAIITLVLLYTYILYQDKYLLMACIASCIAVIYYLIKSISIYLRDKSNWKKSVSDVKELISEE